MSSYYNQNDGSQLNSFEKYSSAKCGHGIIAPIYVNATLLDKGQSIQYTPAIVKNGMIQQYNSNFTGQKQQQQHGENEYARAVRYTAFGQNFKSKII
jgi:hypothetical protein